MRYERVQEVGFPSRLMTLSFSEALLDVHEIFWMQERHWQKMIPKKEKKGETYYSKSECLIDPDSQRETYFYCQLKTKGYSVNISAKDGRRIWDDLMIESHKAETFAS